MSNKLKIVFMALISISLLMLNGCFPKRVVWNPSGQYAAVLGEEGAFYITDSEGNLSEKLYDNVFRIEWFDDNQNFLVAKQDKIENWHQAETKLSKANRDEIIKAAQATHGGNVITEWKANRGMFSSNDNIEDAVKVYIRDVTPEMASNDIIKSWNNTTFDIFCVEKCSWKNKQFKVEKELFNTREIIWDMRISPDEKNLMYTQSSQSIETIALKAYSFENQNILLIDNMVSMYPDWSTDSKSVFYVKIESEEYDDMVIGNLKSATISNDQGELLKETSKYKQVLTLAINGLAKVRCLEDGRIIFSAMEISLPGNTEDFSEQPLLFMIEPGKHKSIVPLVPKNSFHQIAGYDLNFFEMSPDKKYVSMIDHESRVAVMELATGDITVMQPDDLGEIKTVPTWRGQNELCYYSKNENGDFVAIHKPGTPASNLSIEWSDDVKKEIFE